MTQLTWKHINKVLKYLEDDLAKIDQGNLPTYGVKKKHIKRARAAWGLAADCTTFIDFHPWADRYRDNPGDAIVLAGILVHKLSTMPHIVAQLPTPMRELLGELFIQEEQGEFTQFGLPCDETVPTKEANAPDANAAEACDDPQTCSECLDYAQVVGLESLDDVVRTVVRVGGEVHCNINLNLDRNGVV